MSLYQGVIVSVHEKFLRLSKIKRDSFVDGGTVAFYCGKSIGNLNELIAWHTANESALMRICCGRWARFKNYYLEICTPFGNNS